MFKFSVKESEIVITDTASGASLSMPHYHLQSFISELTEIQSATLWTIGDKVKVRFPELIDGSVYKTVLSHYESHEEFSKAAWDLNEKTGIVTGSSVTRAEVPVNFVEVFIPKENTYVVIHPWCLVQAV